MKENQLRKHLKYTLAVRWRAFRQSIRIGKMGRKVFIDSGVSILRYPRNIKIGDSVVIKKGAQICSCNESADISVGDRTTIGFYTFIYSSSSIVIGSDCLIAPFVYIVDSDHSIDAATPINMQPNQTAKIQIADDVWIATGAKILKGVSIGKGAVIGAGAVVINDVPPYTIVGGIPAKEIGRRT